MANSYTGYINTQNLFETAESLTGLTFTTDKTYTIQVQNIAEIKIDEAVFTLKNDIFVFKQGSDDLYIKTNTLGAVLTILEND